MPAFEPPKFPKLDLGSGFKFEPMKIELPVPTAFAEMGRFPALEAFAELGRSIAEAQAAWVEIVKPVMLAMGEAFRDGRRADAVLAAGWVPYAGMPTEQLDAAIEAGTVSQLIEEHTLAEWETIKSRLQDSIQQSGVDGEAQATFEEALQAHEAGLYRSVVRVLFPEIERVARDTVYGGDRREAPKDRQTKGNLNAGLKDFREAVMHELPAGVVTHTKFGLTLTQKMYAHLYNWVGESEESLAQFRNDPVPNRHASLHGYVPYSSRQHSHNMLAMADFMFQLIMRTHDYIEKHSGDADREPAGEADEGA